MSSCYKDPHNSLKSLESYIIRYFVENEPKMYFNPEWFKVLKLKINFIIALNLNFG